MNGISAIVAEAATTVVFFTKAVGKKTKGVDVCTKAVHKKPTGVGVNSKGVIVLLKAVGKKTKGVVLPTKGVEANSTGVAGATTGVENLVAVVVRAITSSPFEATGPEMLKFPVILDFKVRIPILVHPV